MLSRHNQIGRITIESSWKLNNWHPRDSSDPKKPPGRMESASSIVPIVEIGSQWFTAILQCDPKYDQLTYLHFDDKPAGFWMADIVNDDGGVRTYSTTQTLLYMERQLHVVPRMIVLHFFRENAEEDLPGKVFVGWVDRAGYTRLVTCETDAITTNFTNLLETFHRKLLVAATPADSAAAD
jgi:hypothetical protein